jgi:hypothetical protein
MKREHQEVRGTGTFPTGIYGGLHPFELCKSHGKAHNLLETLHLLNLMANLITFYFRNLSTMALLSILSGAHIPHFPIASVFDVLANGNGNIFV